MAKTSHDLRELNYEPREQFLPFHQRTKRWSAIVAHRRAGKALDLKTPILTTEGWSTMGALQTGQYVYDEQGKPTRIVQAHDVLYDRVCYDVEFDDGASIIADAEHLWHTQTKYDRANRAGRKRVNGKTTSGHADPLEGSVKTTEEIKNTLKARGENNHSIPLNKPIQAPSTHMSIPPYMLGVWLGDGASRGFQVTTMDDEIKNDLEQYAKSLNMEFKQVHSANTGKAKTYSIAKPYAKKGTLTGKLKELGVYCNKHIPNSYKYTAKQARIELLRGLMDTDGSIDPRGGRRCEITQKNEQLAHDIVEIIRSLGVKATLNTKYINGKPYYRVYFSPNFNPFKLKRKADIFKAPKKQAFGQNRRIVNVKAVPTRPVRCITVDSPNSLYLAGRELIPTHNTVACVNELVIRALYTQKKRPKYAYIAPFYSQAKNIAWEYLKEAAAPFIAKNKDIRESDLSVELVNGSIIRLYGADNIDALRGIYLDGVVLDEFGDCRPGLWAEVILPTLSDRKGWATIIGTPKGKNTFYHMLEKAKANPDDWYYAELKASETGIVDPEELAALKLQMTEAQYDQEMECSFTAPVLGTYYAGLIQTLETKGQIYHDQAEFDPEFPVYASLDLGFKDSTSIWFWQPRPDGYAIIDYEEAHSQPLSYYFDLFDSKPYEYDTIWLPHDAKAKTLQTGRSTIEQMLDKGFPCEIVPHLKVQQGIDAARLILPECYFHRNSEMGVEGLRAYRRKYNEMTKTFSDTPLHDWASNPADAFRYMALVCEKSGRKMKGRKTGVDILRPAEYTLDELFSANEAAGSAIANARIG